MSHIGTDPKSEVFAGILGVLHLLIIIVFVSGVISAWTEKPLTDVIEVCNQASAIGLRSLAFLLGSITFCIIATRDRILEKARRNYLWATLAVILFLVAFSLLVLSGWPLGTLLGTILGAVVRGTVIGLPIIEIPGPVALLILLVICSASISAGLKALDEGKEGTFVFLSLLAVVAFVLMMFLGAIWS